MQEKIELKSKLNVSDKIKSECWRRRFSSRMLLLCLLLWLTHVVQMYKLPADKLEYAIPGEWVAIVFAMFVVLNWLFKCTESWKIDGLAKVIEALKS